MTDESIFAEALAIQDPAERAAYLDRMCSGNHELRQQVEALLAAHEAGSPLDEPPESLARTGPYVSSHATSGDRVGPYKLLEAIGEGGMGEVWVADQTEPIKRRVAIKLIKPGMDTRSVLARFEAERQALAVMDHPNIAKVLDAGQTDDGRPYFVMELVKGVPITEFCDSRKLTPNERLALFVPVCQAIQHAHMKGIIHRDIKPSNVLVALHDEVPVPKVIDFGVAKAVGVQLTDKTVYTGFGTLIGTPAYMAPEQATFNQLDIDTRADVYALGVLLYELLAGSPPLEKERLKRAALDEVLRIVREEEPPRPSQRLSTTETRASIAALRGTEPEKLSALMKGELDWIVMKALEKDRTRRYETANGFAADVQRYLCGEQVQAVPPSLGYRLKKAYRRNKVAVLGGATIAALLLFGILGTTLGLLAARDAATVAQQNEQKANEAEQAAHDEQAKTQQANQQLERVADLQRRTRYAAEMNLLQAAYTTGNMQEVGRLLEAQRPKPGEPDLRGFEWHYWNRKLNGHIREVRISNGPAGKVTPPWWNSASLSPDGAFIVIFTDQPDGRTVLVMRSTIDGRVLKQAEIQRAIVDQKTPSAGFGTTRRISVSPDGSQAYIEIDTQQPEDIPPFSTRFDWFVWEFATGKVTAWERQESFQGFPREATVWQAGPDTTRPAEVYYRADGEYLIGYSDYRLVGSPRILVENTQTKRPCYCWKRGDKKPLWKQETTSRVSGFVQFLDKGETFARVEYDEREVEVTIHETATGKELHHYAPVNRLERQLDSSRSRGASLRSSVMSHPTVRLSPDGRWLAVQNSTGAIVADLHTCPTRTAKGKLGFTSTGNESLRFKVIEAFRGVSFGASDEIGLPNDGSEVVMFGYSGQGDEIVVRRWAIKGDPAFDPVKPFPFNSYLSPDGRLAVVSSERDFGKPPEANTQNPLRVYSNTGDLLFEAPFTPSNSGSRGFAFTTRSGRHLVGVPGQGWKLVKGFQPGTGRPEYKGPTESSPVIAWDLTARKEVARSKPEPGLSVLAADVDEDNGRLAVAYVPIPKMIGPGGPGGGRGGFGSGPAAISAVKVYSFPAMQWLQDLPLPKDSPPPRSDLRFDTEAGEWAAQVGVGPTSFQEARWTARTGEFRGLVEIPRNGRAWKETSNGKQILQVVTGNGGTRYIIRDKSSGLADEIPVINPAYMDSYFPARLSPDGTRLLVLSDPPRMYDVATGRELLTLPREREKRFGFLQKPNPLHDGLWSADGTQFWYALDSKGKLVGFDARPVPEPKP